MIGALLTLLTLILLLGSNSTVHDTHHTFNDSAALDTSQVWTADDDALADAVCMCNDAALWWRGYYQRGDES